MSLDFQRSEPAWYVLNLACARSDLEEYFIAFIFQKVASISI